MKIRFKILGIQCLLLFIVLSSLGIFLVILNNSINPMINRLTQDVNALDKISAIETFTLRMVSLREDLQQVTENYINISNESAITKYNFAAKKLREAINGALRKSERGETLFNISVVETKIEEIEKNIFSLAQQGNVEEARVLLANVEYKVLLNNYDTFIEQFLYRNKAEAQDQFSKLVFLLSSIEAGRQGLSNLMRIIILSLIVIFVVSLTVNFVVSLSFSKPIIHLHQGVKKIRKGDLTHKIEVKTKDEIGDLTNSFNEMTENLQKITVSKNYTDNIIKSMTDSLIVVDPDAKIKIVNKATCDLLGYTEEGLIGNDVSLMFAEEEEEEEKEEGGLLKGTSIKKLIKQGSIYNSNITFRAKSGEKIPVSFSGSVMKSKEGEIEGIVGIAKDMREMKRLFEKERELVSVATKAAEAEKKKTVELENAFGELEKSQDMTLNYMEDLEIQRKEFERQYEETKQKSKLLEQAQTVSLKIMEDLDLKRKEVEEREKKLKETQAMLVQAGKLSAMGQLGAGIAHELNQPLAAIRGYTQVLIEEIKNNDPHLEDLKMIEEQTGRMGTIVNNIRTFARDSKFTLEWVNIHKPIEDAFTLLTTQLTNHNIEVVKDYGQDIPQIKADSNQLQQVFINLISNARDELDKNNGGKIWISTRTLKLGKQRRNIAISFKNDGTLIPEEIIGQIFDPFFTTKDSGKGTGLGLSISYGIIKDHQGEIMVANKEDGVEFVIYLPIDTKGKNAKDI